MRPGAALPYPDADLREHPPRSARAMLGGLYFLPRTIDKTRARLQGTLGLYKIGPGFSIYLFEWLGIAEDEFTEAVRAANSDDDVVAWIYRRCDPNTFASINERLVNRAIRDDAHFAEVLPRYPVLAEQPHLRNWFEILDLDDAWIFRHAERRARAQAARVGILRSPKDHSMNEKPVTSPGEAGRQGLDELDEHAHPHHPTTAHTPPPSKHQTPAVGPEPTEHHRAGPLPHR